MNKKTLINNDKMELLIKDLESDFIHLIKNRLGILIHSHQVNSLQKTLLVACEKFNLMPKEYLNLLTACSDDSPLIDYLVTEITIGETYFFRDKHQMKLLENILLPSLIARKRQQKQFSLRIWSAGCATGEEIYTVAMMLEQLLPDYSEWSIQLLGTDINTISLKNAIKGNYSSWSMRTIADFYKQKYFEKNNDRYVLSENVRNKVNFDYLNLSDNNYPSISNGTNAQDLILCRNVLIYFDAVHAANLMKKINSCLSVGGFLLLGASDPIVISDTDLVIHHMF